jgi:hypothetical protein
MSIGLTIKLVQTAYKVSSGRNEYGDITYQAANVGSPCLYRDISILSRRNVNREEIEIDGLLWFDKNESLAKGDVYLLDSEYLRIEKITAARRRIANNALMFYKCEVTKQRQVS